MKSAFSKVLTVTLLGFSFISIASASLEDNSIEQELNKENTQELNVDFSLKTFDSCKNMEDVMGDYVKDYWEENWKNRPQYPVYYNRFGGDMIMENGVDFQESEAVMDDAVSVKSTSSIAGASNDFSQTNTQVKGVDESDIVKTDGKYAYYYNSKDKYVYIVDLSDQDDLQVIKKIKVPKNFYSPVLYIDDNRLVIVSGGYSQSNYKNNYWYSRNQKTYTVVFDTSDIENPKLIKMYASEGNFRKSRKIGDYLYVLSNNSFNIPYYTFRSKKDIQFSSNDIIPKAVELTKIDNLDDQNLKIKDKKYPYSFKAGKAVECDEISYALPGKDTLKKFDFSPSYNVISVININDVEESVNTDVIAGNNAEIFMSQDNLYLTSYMYQNYDFRCPRGMFCSMPFYSRGENTLLHKINVDKNELTYKDSTIISGQPLTQYSMDEHDGKFRIITQKSYPERETGVYVLDKNLKLLGNLGGLGKTENFKSSRFMGDKLFLVTFKQVDPFYVVDMSTDQPKVMGELKIPGYSTYLHPYDENHIIGIGYNTTQNKWGGTMNDGIKIDLYEIDYDRKPKKSQTWVEEENRLLQAGCTQIQIDVDGNSCSLNENKTAYDMGCTEMVTTKKLELPECIAGNFQKNLGDIYVAQKFTKTLGGNGSYSEALNNPRMFMWNAAKNTLLLPAQLYVNSPEDYYKRIDFYQGLFALEIDKDTGISEKYRVSHIDFDDIEKQRADECSKYSQKKDESNCKLLLDGTEYCTTKKYSYVPQYCFADSHIGEYKANKSYNYRNDYVKRSLWIGNTAISISDNKMMTNDLESGKKYDAVNLK